LKYKLGYYKKDIYDFNVTSLQNKYNGQVKSFLEYIKDINFKETYPDQNLDEMLPQFHIDEEGYAKINDAEVLSGKYITEDIYKNIKDIDEYEFYERVLSNDPNFNITSITKAIDRMTEEGPQFKIFNDVDKIFRKNIIYDIIDDDDTEEFKTKNGTMSVEINGYVLLSC